MENITVYIGENKWLFSNQYLELAQDENSYLLIEEVNILLLAQLLNTQLHKTLLASPELFKQLKQSIKIIIAGGGVVFNNANEILFIFRRGKWDLPKGKLDKGETIEQCALREVQEETNASDLILDKYLCTSYHIYAEKKEIVLKETYWYTMHTNDTHFVPQAEEQIEEVLFVHPSNFKQIMDNTYDNIKAILTLI